MMSSRRHRLILATTILFSMMMMTVESFHMVMMVKRGKGGLKQNLEDAGTTSKKRKGAGSLNQGKGQEITGVTLPANGAYIRLVLVLFCFVELA